MLVTCTQRQDTVGLDVGLSLTAVLELSRGVWLDSDVGEFFLLGGRAGWRGVWLSGLLGDMKE